MNIFIRWGALALAIWVSTLVVPGIDVHGGVFTYFWVAFLFATINTFIGSLVKVLTFPISLITLGIFLIVINAAMLMLTARWSEKLDITGFWSATLAALIISAITTIIRRSNQRSKF